MNLTFFKKISFRNIFFKRFTFNVLTFTVIVVLYSHAKAQRNDLKVYTTQKEASYSYKITEEIKETESTIFKVKLTSLQWLTHHEVDRPFWRHDVTIVVPHTLKTATALILIDGGRDRELFSFAENDALKVLKQLAEAISAVVVQVQTVPFQPLEFFQDGQKRVEDNIIAFSWDQFLKTQNPTWLAQFPMVKSVVKAMDATESILWEKKSLKLKAWVPTGGSKRGWTAWLVAAVDPRVKGLVPIVFDALNLIPSFQHHFASYGFWSEAVKDYVAFKIMDRITTPGMHTLASLVDPYSYRKVLTMPKMIINAANDEFFLPDSSLFYWQQLSGPKYLRYLPNSGHRLNNADFIYNIINFFHSLEDPSYKLPNLFWQYADSQLWLSLDQTPFETQLWQATNPDLPDFRFSYSEQRYASSAVALQPSQPLALSISPPTQGWKSFFVTATFPAKDTEVTLSTNIFIIDAQGRLLASSPEEALSPSK